MSNPLRIGIDLDGCLADFNTSFIDLIANETGIQLPPVSDGYPDCWAYHRAGGVSPEQDKHLWNSIRNSSSFWFDLAPLPGALEALSDLRLLGLRGWEIYFITARNGKLVKLQTENWLFANGFPHATVLISDRNGFVARGLDLDAFIDDRPENCMDVLGGSLARVYMVERPYNRSSIAAQSNAVTIVKSVSEAVEQEISRNGKA